MKSFLVKLSLLYNLKSANLSCKGSNSKYFRLCNPTTSLAANQFYHCSMKVAIDNSTQFMWLCSCGGPAYG